MIKYTKELLTPIISSSFTLKETLIKLNLRAAGRNFYTLKKYIELYQIDTSHFDISRTRNSQYKSLTEILIENSSYSRGALKIRLYNEGLKERRCEIEGCGQGEFWLGKKISLILDHINGIHNDNRLENLRIVCPNCNAALDTHCGKNKKHVSKYKPKKIQSYCLCGAKTTSKKAKQCRKCFDKNRRIVERPSQEILQQQIATLGYVATGKLYGVSDNAIRKWL